MVVKLHCPNFWGFERVYQDLLQAPKEYKRKNVEITAAYGCFPGMIWNGGRPQNLKQINIKRIEQEFNLFYNKLHLPIELTFNNMLIKDNLVYDKYCNQIAEIANEYNVICTIVSPYLEDYLRHKFKNLRFKRSCIACENGEDYDIYNKYDMSVLNQFKGGDTFLLKSIPKEQRNKIELVADVECADGCTQFYKHHRCSAECQLYGYSRIQFNCPLGKKYLPIYFSRKQKHYISPNRAQKLAKLGYEHYKLVSRCNIGQALHEICFYYFKEEYVPDCLVRAYLMMGVPMKIDEPIDYAMYLGEDYVGEIYK